MQKNVLTSCLCLKIYLDSWLFSRLVRHFSENLIYAFSGESVNVLGAQKITNLGKLPSEQKRKTPKQQKKIKIIKENSQVKKENSQALN